MLLHLHHNHTPCSNPAVCTVCLLLPPPPTMLISCGKKVQVARLRARLRVAQLFPATAGAMSVWPCRCSLRWTLPPSPTGTGRIGLSPLCVLAPNAGRQADAGSKALAIISSHCGKLMRLWISLRNLLLHSGGRGVVVVGWWRVQRESVNSSGIYLVYTCRTH